MANVSSTWCISLYPSSYDWRWLVNKWRKKENFDHVIDMLNDLSLHPKNPDPKIMNLENIGTQILIGTDQPELEQVEV